MVLRILGAMAGVSIVATALLVLQLGNASEATNNQQLLQSMNSMQTQVTKIEKTAEILKKQVNKIDEKYPEEVTDQDRKQGDEYRLKPLPR